MEAITLAELLRALEDASKGRAAGEGFTTTEMCEAKPMSIRRAREIIRRGIKDGTVRVSRKTITDLAGRPQSVASYVFVKRRRR